MGFGSKFPDVQKVNISDAEIMIPIDIQQQTHEPLLNQLKNLVGTIINPARKEDIEALEQRLDAYGVESVDLGTAHSDTALEIAGRLLQIWSISAGATCSIKFNATTEDAISIDDGIVDRKIPIEFSNVYITNGVQAGLSIVFIYLKRA